MDKLRIGIMVDEHCLPDHGGSFTYYHTLLKAINQYSWHSSLEIINVLAYSTSAKPAFLTKHTLVVNNKYIYSVAYLWYKLVYLLFYHTGKKRYKTRWQQAALQIVQLKNANTERILEANKIDLVYYLKPDENCISYPLIATHWDVGHRSMYSFPEVALDGNYEAREKYYATVLNKAFLIICESQSGAKELLQYYALNAAKIKVIPLFSGEVVRQQVAGQEQLQVLQRYGLERRKFFLYPAQFWAHKNHYNLLQAFHAFQQEAGGSGIKLVLCGSDKGNLSYIKDVIRQLHAADHIVLPGYVPDRDLYVLYKNALALVMPTFLGPTNIPLLEAAELQCPVLCSDIEGHREMLGEAALYFNPADAAAIKRSMQMVQDPCVQAQLVTEANQQLAGLFSVEKSMQLLEQILLYARPIRKTWGTASCIALYLLACSLLAA